MKTSWIVILPIAAALVSPGCINGMQFWKTDRREETAPPDETPAARVEAEGIRENRAKRAEAPVAPETETSTPYHQGWDISVRLDGKATRPFRKDGGQQIWTVTTCGKTPEILFIPNEKRLGPIKPEKTYLSIYPLLEDKTTADHFYRYAGNEKLEAGNATTMNAFEHLKGDALELGITELPEGWYRFKLHVEGTVAYDRQIIELEIR